MHHRIRYRFSRKKHVFARFNIRSIWFVYLQVYSEVEQTRAGRRYLSFSNKLIKLMAIFSGVINHSIVGLVFLLWMLSLSVNTCITHSLFLFLSHSFWNVCNLKWSFLFENLIVEILSVKSKCNKDKFCTICDKCHVSFFIMIYILYLFDGWKLSVSRQIKLEEKY